MFSILLAPLVVLFWVGGLGFVEVLVSNGYSFVSSSSDSIPADMPNGVRSARSPTSSLVTSTAPLLLQLSARELKKVLEKYSRNKEKEDEI